MWSLKVWKKNKECLYVPLSLFLWSLLINSVTLSLSIWLAGCLAEWTLSLSNWLAEGINALFIFYFSLFFFVFLNWAIVFILSVGVMLVNVCSLCWCDINCRLVYIVIYESCEIFWLASYCDWASGMSMRLVLVQCPLSGVGVDGLLGTSHIGSGVQ